MPRLPWGNHQFARAGFREVFEKQAAEVINVDTARAGGIAETRKIAAMAQAYYIRKDVLHAARDLRIPILRWPGGNFVSGYHWTDGIGPMDGRPRRIELAWRGEEPNHFGTDEFVEYCRVLGTEPYICVNMGSGSMDEAQAWVEYCNGRGNTYWANLRRANGHQEPYNVKYWGLGNEMYGAWQIGASTAEDYVKKARQFAAIMKWTDPSIELVSCGQWGWTDWDKTVIDGLAPYVLCETLIDRARYEQNIQHPIGIAFDEWNVWYRTRAPDQRQQGLEEQYDLSDAQAVATYLNIFIRHCRSVEIANFAQMVNAIAPISTNREGLFLQTIYHPLRLFAEHAQDVALDVFVDSPTYDLTAEQEAQPYEVNGADPTIRNSFEQPEAVTVHMHQAQAAGDSVEYTFPAHSVTLLRGQVS
jgi:alpha-N-arabinofuranosidase